MTNEEIKSILKEKEVKHLYHANTVATACTFLDNGGLLSRGYVEDHDLFQTSQMSDEDDQQVDVFYDIFFDSVDVHKRGNDRNKYGPVTFVYSVDVIDTLSEGELQITKDNPIYWEADLAEEKRYFQKKTELLNYFDKNDFSQHITIRHQYQPLSFEYLEKIVIDNPKIDDTSYFEEAYAALEERMKENKIRVPFKIRTCSSGCHCKKTYGRYQKGYFYHQFGLQEKEEHDEGRA